MLDDRATERDLLCTALGDAGHTVARASTGQEAVGIAQVSVPDLVIVDMGTDPFNRAQLRVLNTKLIDKIDELERAERRTEEKAEQLVIASKYKSEFFSNISHELRTLLNGLLILAGELRANPDQNLTEAQVQYATMIESSAMDLLRLLNDLLDLAKVESGTITLEFSDVSMLDLKDSLEREFRHVAARRGVGFSVCLASGRPPMMSTDSGRLRQVLRNLLVNAFKFTEAGAVTVRISPAEHGWVPSNDRLGNPTDVIAFSISDTGIGIAPDLQQRIFDAFAQADGTTARQYGGTGLGLSISRQLADLLGGEIGLTSSLGVGSTFTLYLPVDWNSDHRLAGPAARRAPELVSSTSGRDDLGLRPAPQTELAASIRLGGIKVLVVDDDFRNIFAIAALLERKGLEVVSAESGAAGLAVLKETQDIDIVLMDIMMPAMDGYATMRAIRKVPGIEQLPIIALTAKTGDDERQRCVDAGASAYVCKPVSTRDLLCVLCEWLPVQEAASSGAA